jgi:hypothetical protein
MRVLGWLAIPVAATLLAILWVLWRSRPKPPAAMHETLESYEKFKQVFDGPRWREGRRDEHGRLPSARAADADERDRDDHR